MAKADMLGESLWDAYSNKVTTLMNNPQHQGEIFDADAEANGNKLIVADFGAESCGDAVRLYWEIDPKTDKIVNSKFKSFGCGTAIASSDVMTELCIGKTVQEAVKITNIDVELALRDDPETPAVPPQKMHCSVMAYDVIIEAAAKYKGVDADTLRDEEIVCECARTTRKEIVDIIKKYNCKTIEELQQYTKAGTYCKSCVAPGGHEEKPVYLVDILAEVNGSDPETKTENSENEIKDFGKLPLFKQIKEIEKIIDKNIKPALAMDGGSLEILDIQKDDDGIKISMRYLGACSGCASSSTGTLYAIEAVLKEKLDESIRVLPI